MKGLGWQAQGIEPSQEAAGRAREKGLDVFAGDLIEANLPDNFFDVVRLWHVLKHTRDPQQVLIEAKRILRPGGS